VWDPSRVLQEYLYEHLWLLDPSWDRATENPHIEQSVHKDTYMGASLKNSKIIDLMSRIDKEL